MPAEFFNSLLNLRAKLIYAGGVCGRWAIDHNSNTAIWFHLVTKGDSWIHYPPRPKAVPLQEGDVVVFLPHAQLHYLSYSPRELRFDDPHARKTSWEEGSTGFVCALIDLNLPSASFWRALPAEIIIRNRQADGILADLTRRTIEESRQQRFGSYYVIERLCDNIFVLMMRHCIEHGLIREGVFAAMQDRRIETVLSLIHREPWHPWTLAKLGAAAGISKTVLTAKFTAMMGCPPGEYLIRWRMQTAASCLHDSRIGLEVVAERCGYFSVSAFSRVFKRYYGVSPGVFRRRVPPRAAIGRAPHSRTSKLMNDVTFAHRLHNA